MKEVIFTGSGVALVTPFHDDFSINYDELERLVEYQIENGTDLILACGTTGESSTMTEEEHLSVIRFMRSFNMPGGSISGDLSSRSHVAA